MLSRDAECIDMEEAKTRTTPSVEATHTTADTGRLSLDSCTFLPTNMKRSKPTTTVIVAMIEMC